MRRIARTSLARWGSTAACLLAYRTELYATALVCGVAAFYAWTTR
jgi:hypothetical protein